MKYVNYLYYYTFIVYAFIFLHSTTQPKTTPSIVCVVIIDSLSFLQLSHAQPYMHGGIKTLLENGITYTQAHVPHGLPVTSPGHTGIATGTFPSLHGIIANQWYDKTTGHLIQSDHTLKKNSTSPYNEDDTPSSALCLVPTSGDYLTEHSTIKKGFKVSSIGIKRYPTILTAGKKGSPFWLDPYSGTFTTTPAALTRLPRWIKRFNTQLSQHYPMYITWNSCYPLSHKAYASCDYRSYLFTKESLINRSHALPHTTFPPFDTLSSLPFSNQLVFACALHQLHDHKHRAPQDHLLLWLCLSSHDTINHHFGPESFESFDTLYQIDKQLHQFMQAVDTLYPKDTVCYILTADHGSSPLPELMNLRGYNAARLPLQELIRSINKTVSTLYGIPKAIECGLSTQLYLHNDVHTSPDKDAIMYLICSIIASVKGIRNVWTVNTLFFPPTSPQHWLIQQQWFSQRSGDIFYLAEPFHYVTTYDDGTEHNNPYSWNTHVPLILYQHDHYEHKDITQPVFTLQIAATIAHLFKQPTCIHSKALPPLPELFP
ncbi:MAG: alkaline phosphatase family protein [Candidatus Babeliales bacterium]